MTPLRQTLRIGLSIILFVLLCPSLSDAGWLQQVGLSNFKTAAALQKIYQLSIEQLDRLSSLDDPKILPSDREKARHIKEILVSEQHAHSLTESASAVPGLQWLTVESPGFCRAIADETRQQFNQRWQQDMRVENAALIANLFYVDITPELHKKLHDSEVSLDDLGIALRAPAEGTPRSVVPLYGLKRPLALEDRLKLFEIYYCSDLLDAVIALSKLKLQELYSNNPTKLIELYDGQGAKPLDDATQKAYEQLSQALLQHLGASLWGAAFSLFNDFDASAASLTAHNLTGLTCAVSDDKRRSFNDLLLETFKR